MENIKKATLNVGEHFWGIIGEEIFIGLKTPTGAFVCGDWEGEVSDEMYKVVEVVKMPEGFKDKKLVYSHCFHE